MSKFKENSVYELTSLVYIFGDDLTNLEGRTVSMEELSSYYTLFEKGERFIYRESMFYHEEDEFKVFEENDDFVKFLRPIPVSELDRILGC